MEPRNATPPRLIALDLDGTLLHSDKTISKANHDAVVRVLDAGVKVVLASGRMHSATVKYAHQMEFRAESYIVSYSGAMVRTIAGETLMETPLDAETAEEIIHFAQEKNFHLNVYLKDVLYNAVHDEWTDLYRKRTGCIAEIVGDLTQFIDRRPSKLLIVNHASEIAKLLPEMQKRFEGRLSVMKTDDEYLEFMALDADKGRAIEAIAAKSGISRDECLAMGDNYNDLSMLLWAGRPYVMSSGRPDLLERLPQHAPAADEDGVAQVLNAVFSENAMVS